MLNSISIWAWHIKFRTHKNVHCIILLLWHVRPFLSIVWLKKRRMNCLCSSACVKLWHMVKTFLLKQYNVTIKYFKMSNDNDYLNLTISDHTICWVYIKGFIYSKEINRVGLCHLNVHLKKVEKSSIYIDRCYVYRLCSMVIHEAYLLVFKLRQVHIVARTCVHVGFSMKRKTLQLSVLFL